MGLKKKTVAQFRSAREKNAEKGLQLGVSLRDEAGLLRAHRRGPSLQRWSL